MYVAIAGNIGSGKTTLTEILAKRYGARAYYEESDNPYIGDFYNDMSRWAFQLQVAFLGSRIGQTVEMLSSSEANVFQDRTIYEDAHIFASNLHEMGLMYYSMLAGANATTYPVTFVLDAEGKITFSKIGGITYDALKAEIEKAIAAE